MNNRRGLRLALDRLLTAGKALSVIALDIDHFKDVNDRYGHDVGDQVLKHLAEHMRECFRAGDVMCRAGGEEFIVLLPELEIEAAHKIAERLRLSMASQPSPSGEVVTISLGVAYMPKGNSSIDTALRASDAALYKAKNQGRNCVVSASEF